MQKLHQRLYLILSSFLREKNGKDDFLLATSCLLPDLLVLHPQYHLVIMDICSLLIQHFEHFQKSRLL